MNFLRQLMSPNAPAVPGLGVARSRIGYQMASQGSALPFLGLGAALGAEQEREERMRRDLARADMESKIQLAQLSLAQQKAEHYRPPGELAAEARGASVTERKRQEGVADLIRQENLALDRQKTRYREEQDRVNRELAADAVAYQRRLDERREGRAEGSLDLQRLSTESLIASRGAGSPMRDMSDLEKFHGSKLLKDMATADAAVSTAKKARDSLIKKPDYEIGPPGEKARVLTRLESDLETAKEAAKVRRKALEGFIKKQRGSSSGSGPISLTPQQQLALVTKANPQLARDIRETLMSPDSPPEAKEAALEQLAELMRERQGD